MPSEVYSQATHSSSTGIVGRCSRQLRRSERLQQQQQQQQMPPDRYVAVHPRGLHCCRVSTQLPPSCIPEPAARRLCGRFSTNHGPLAAPNLDSAHRYDGVVSVAISDAIVDLMSGPAQAAQELASLFEVGVLRQNNSETHETLRKLLFVQVGFACLLCCCRQQCDSHPVLSRIDIDACQALRPIHCMARLRVGIQRCFNVVVSTV